MRRKDKDEAQEPSDGRKIRTLTTNSGEIHEEIKRDSRIKNSIKEDENKEN